MSCTSQKLHLSPKTSHLLLKTSQNVTSTSQNVMFTLQNVMFTCQNVMFTSQNVTFKSQNVTYVPKRHIYVSKHHIRLKTSHQSPKTSIKVPKRHFTWSKLDADDTPKNDDGSLSSSFRIHSMKVGGLNDCDMTHFSWTVLDDFTKMSRSPKMRTRGTEKLHRLHFWMITC